MRATLLLTSPVVPSLLQSSSFLSLLLTLAAPVGVLAQRDVAPTIIEHPPSPDIVADMMAWNVRDLTPADSAVVYRVALSTGLSAILATTDPRARPLYLDGRYPAESAAFLQSWVSSGAISRVCQVTGKAPCKRETPRSIDLGALEVIHRDTVIVSFEVDARRRYESLMQLVDPAVERAREWEVGIFTPLHLPGRACWVQMPDPGPRLTIARSHGTWIVVRVDRPGDGRNQSGC